MKIKPSDTHCRVSTSQRRLVCWSFNCSFSVQFPLFVVGFWSDVGPGDVLDCRQRSVGQRPQRLEEHRKPVWLHRNACLLGQQPKYLEAQFSAWWKLRPSHHLCGQFKSYKQTNKQTKKQKKVEPTDYRRESWDRPTPSLHEPTNSWVLARYHLR